MASTESKRNQRISLGKLFLMWMKDVCPFSAQSCDGAAVCHVSAFHESHVTQTYAVNLNEPIN